MDPIAIIGMSCRFAGDVDTPAKLWELLAEGRSAWSPIPEERFNAAGFQHPNTEKLNATNVVGGHFLKEDIGLFDANFFNLSAETAAALDPQFRLQLESTYEALESAGLTLQSVAGSDTSVFAGSFFRDYHETQIREPDSLPRFLLMGTGAAMASNRLSHFFDLRGPSMSIDTGCSTTLTALHQGCQSLRAAECGMSIVGGANVMFNPDMFLAMSSMTLISRDGKSYAFDHRASGYGRGEGTAVVVLKRLADALRDGDPVRAIIRDTGLNQDGKTETITTPSGEAQEALVRECYRRAGLDPAQTAYFEAHGTGTPTGDPIEVGAIAKVFTPEGRAPGEAGKLRIGSVKTNIGHTETASGLAAIIKVALALEHGQIPPSVNFERPNPKLRLGEWGLKVPTSLEAWPETASSQGGVQGGVKRASINNFGYGGTNAHVIMESLDSYLSSNTNGTLTNGHTNGVNGHSLTNGINGHAQPNGYTNGNTINGHNRKDSGISISSDSPETPETIHPHLFTLSGKDERATTLIATNLATHLSTLPPFPTPQDESVFLSNLAHTLNHRRTQFPWISTFSASSLSSLVKTLQSGRVKPVKREGAGEKGVKRIGFVYTGQGAQWWAMGRELVDVYPVFEGVLGECTEVLRGLGVEWGVVEELSRDATTTRVNQLEYSTPVCVAVQIALTILLRTFGIHPTAVTSHSSGEIAAAYAAGALDLPSAMTIAYARGGMASEGSKSSVLKGGMIAVGLGAEEGKKWLPKIKAGKVVLACENSPSSITVSGDVDGIEELEATLKKENVFARRLKVDAAWHSHHMEAVADAYYAAMDGKIRPASEKLTVAFSSPATGTRLGDIAEIGAPGHWVRSLTGPVRFVEAFTSMVFDGKSEEPAVDMVIEVGPHAALSGPIQDILGLPVFEGTTIPYASCLVRKKHAVETMHALVSTLIQKSYPSLDLAAVNFPLGTTGLRVLHDLPPYPWNHSTRHWIEPRANKALRARKGAPHDLLGALVPGTNMASPTWRHFVRINELPWVRDHVVQGDVIYPAAGYLSMAIEGAAFVAHTQTPEKVVKGYRLRDVEITSALVVPETSEGIEVQLSLRPCTRALDTVGWTEFVVSSVTLESKWTEHCRGLIRVEYSPKTKTVTQPTQDSAYRVRISPKDIYAGLQSGGINHGPVFQNITSIRARHNQSVTAFVVADAAATMPKGHQHPHVVHPTTLDSVFQAAYTALPGAGNPGKDTPKVPRSFKSLWISSDISSVPGTALKAFTALEQVNSQTMTTSITVAPASQGTAVITLSKFTCQSIGTPPSPLPAHHHQKFTTTTWTPSTSHLTPSFLQTHLGTPISSTESAQLIDLRRACLIYITHALSGLTTADVKKLEWFQRKFYLWMQLQVELARTNRLAPDSQLWLAQAVAAPTNPKLLAEQQAFLKRVESDSTNGEIVSRLGEQIVSILRGEVTALQVMLEDGLLSRYYLTGLKWARANGKLAKLVALHAAQHPRAKILEIGGGTGGATTQVLRELAALPGGGVGEGVGSYDFTDVSSGFFEAARDKFRDWDGVMRYRKLDVEQGAAEQGFEEGSYDVVIACQVLHATASMERTMGNVRRLLKPGGKLFVMETTRDQIDVQFVFGFLAGWWLSEEEERKFSPSLSIPMWDSVLQRTGFRGVEAEVHDCDDEDLYSFSIMTSTATPPRPKFDFDISLVTVGDDVPADWLDQLRLSIGLLTWTVPTVGTLESAAQSPLEEDTNKVTLLIDSPTHPVLAAPSPALFAGIQAVCTRSRGVLWLTHGGGPANTNPLASLAPGFLRALRQEYRGKPLGTLDLDAARGMFSEGSVAAVTGLFKTFFSEPVDGTVGRDFEFAEKEGVVYVPRLVKDRERNARVYAPPASDAPVTPEEAEEEHLEPYLQPTRPLHLDLTTLKFTDDPFATVPLPDDFIELDPRAFSFPSLGPNGTTDVAGLIARASPTAAAMGLRVGERVLALLPPSSSGSAAETKYASRPRTHWSTVVPLPANLSLSTAAALPTAYTTAYLAVYDIARLQPGESVLVHELGSTSTSGVISVGLAAVQLAQRVGAEVYVTVSSEEEALFVQTKLGIKPERVFTSPPADDTDEFVERVREVSGGEGVDIVLTTLPGPALQTGLACLAPLGRLVDVSPGEDAAANKTLAMEAFSRGVTVSRVDVPALVARRPMQVNRVLKQVVRLVGTGEIGPIEPVETLSLSEVVKGVTETDAVVLVGPETVVPTTKPTQKTTIRPDATYLIIGGFGGIGRSIAHWLAAHGARHLLVLSRSSGGSAGKAQLASLQEELAAAGHKEVNVSAVSCDISRMDELSRVLDAHVLARKPPIKGVIHGGMELQDAVFEHMTPQTHAAALAPKLLGTHNLHTYFSRPTDLDFLILLSSLVGVVGFASQANYAAAGAYQDALASHRTSPAGGSLPCVALDLGIVKSVGYLADDDREGLGKTIEKLRYHGFTALSEEDVLGAVAEAVRDPMAGCLSLGLNTGPTKGDMSGSPMVTDLRFAGLAYQQPAATSSSTTTSSGSATDLAALLSGSGSPEEAAGHVTTALAQKLTDIFMLGEGEVVPGKSPADYGVDSLVAVELRNMLALKAGADLSIFEIMQSGSLTELGGKVAAKSRFVGA
ncbi:hypothetical protein B0J18DRAFT_473798 [Chaetomium sp. MPI-SDFR-AT-0129]|nr:hypothetical protein B0J18DRAFT_473798 [Chaetomium sp. MPI-SDFR-AT-0129]